MAKRKKKEEQEEWESFLLPKTGLLIEYSVSNLHICTVLYVSMYVIPCVQEPYDRKTAKRALFARLTKCELDTQSIMRLEKTFPTVYIKRSSAPRF